MTLNPEVATVVILLVAIVVFIWNRVSPAMTYSYSSVAPENTTDPRV